MFLIGGTDIAARTQAMRLFDPAHPLREQGVLRLDPPVPGAPGPAGALSISREHLSLFSTGAARKPDYAVDFPARRLATALDWSDLVLQPEVLEQLNHVAAWLEHERAIMDGWGLGRVLAPGYRCLFYGPPGTGKTLSVALLGKRSGLDVYRIDLSMIVSKYIGETEKNLAGVFDQAAHKNWILFFDEADALFGARGGGGTANDRYANQEVAYLLQRIETCPSLVILATNLKGNLDDAFSRRFQSMVGFVRPDALQRERLWRGVLVPPLSCDDTVDPRALAEKYDLVGGAIVNVVRHAAISAMRRSGPNAINQSDLIAAISSELRKEGRTL
jgi:SpoVK/Ycf46/Vps4 family AAA+-type ATPase